VPNRKEQQAIEDLQTCLQNVDTKKEISLDIGAEPQQQQVNLITEIQNGEAQERSATPDRFSVSSSSVCSPAVEVSKLLHQLTVLQEEKDWLENRLARLEKEKTQLGAKNETQFSAAVDSLQKENKTLRSDKATLQTKIKEFEEVLSDAGTQIRKNRDLEARYRSVQVLRDSLESRCSEYQISIEMKEKELQTFKQKNDLLQQEIHRHSLDLHTAESNLEVLQSEYNIVVEDLTKAKIETAEARMAGDNAQHELQKLMMKISGQASSSQNPAPKKGFKFF